MFISLRITLSTCDISGTRQVFDRWMEWEPDEQAWLTYIKFELRYKEIDKARGIYEKFVYVHPEVHNWIKFARYVLACQPHIILNFLT